jgi:SAM-dependent methyltransferase
MYGRLNGRLALFQRTSTQQSYWVDYWTKTPNQVTTASGEDGEIPELGDLVERSAPRDKPILEAGCGPGHVVAALTARGYTAIGIEYEPSVVERARKTHEHLDLRVGDVRALEIPSETIGCYLSLGVVEHFTEGPVAILREARRVLARDGVALVSVPYLNPLRRAHLDRQPGTTPDGLSFHQYYFSVEEFTQLAEEAGFEVIEQLPYAVEAFLGREHPVFSRIWSSRLLRGKARDRVRRGMRNASMRIRERYAHMIMFVCRPATSGSRDRESRSRRRA